MITFCFAGYSRTEHEFNHHYGRMHQHGEVYTSWLDEIPREKWVQAFDGGHRYGHMTTNLVECINSVLKGARNLPITALVRATYFRLAELFATKGREAHARRDAGFIFSEALTTRLREIQQVSGNVRVTRFSRQNQVFHVQDLTNGDEFSVDLIRRYCDCGDFQTDRYPCRHVIACCANQNIDWQVYIDSIYSMEKVCKVYDREFQVVGNRSTWPPYNGPVIRPNPQLKRNMKGRPRSTRFLNEMDMREMRGPKRCTVCRGEGHSRRQCPLRSGAN